MRGALAQRRADAAAHSSRGAVAQALLAAKALGEIPGIHGRLGMRAKPAGGCHRLAADLRIRAEHYVRMHDSQLRRPSAVSTHQIGPCDACNWIFTGLHSTGPLCNWAASMFKRICQYVQATWGPLTPNLTCQCQQQLLRWTT